MNVTVKYLLKNIFLKPFRTFILVFCVMCCGFVASLSLDLSSKIEFIVYSMLAQVTGTSDMIITMPSGAESEIDSIYEAGQLPVKSRQDALIERYSDESMYNVFRKHDFTVMTFDYETAEKMRLIDRAYALKKNEAVISDLFSERSGLAAGDEISLINDNKEEVVFRITDKVKSKGLANGKECVFVSEDGWHRLTESERINTIYADVKDDGHIYNFKDDVLNQYYNADADVIRDLADTKEQADSMRMIFLLIFLVCLLLVVFVAVSVSARIVCERMSVTGTLRSLGISPSYAAGLLISENAIYGLIGGGIGTALYCLARQSVYSAFLQVDAGSGISLSLEIPAMNPVTAAVTLLISTVLMCLCPLKEIIKTSRMPIRDIIFDNKDTEYRYSKVNLAAGAVMTVAACIFMIFRYNPVLQIAAFVLFVFGMSLLFPFLIRVLTGFIEKAADRAENTLLQLAAKFAGTRKCTVGSSVMCFAVSLLALIIYIFSSMANNFYSLDTYSSDLIVKVTPFTDTDKFYYADTLPGVTGAERIYEYYDKININGIKKDMYIVAQNEGGYRYLSGIKDVPEHIGKFEFYMDRISAERLKLKPGDEAEIEFALNDFLPVTEKLTFAGYMDSSEHYAFGEMIVISKEMYLGIYKDYASDILIKCDNPESVKEDIMKHSGRYVELIQTNDEFHEYWNERKTSMKTMLYFLIATGVALTLTGMVSNLLIGFEGRKRECAVMLSTSMTRGNLSEMFFAESFFTAVISLAAAVPAALLAFKPFINAAVLFTGNLNGEYNIGLYLIFAAVLVIIFTMVALFPVRQIYKMNTAEQLKYE